MQATEIRMRASGATPEGRATSRKGWHLEVTLIAQAATTRPIVDVAAELGLTPDDLELYGPNKAKIATPALNRLLASLATGTARSCW